MSNAEPENHDPSLDLTPAEFRAAMHRVADLAADYLEHVAEGPVLPATRPGDVRKLLPASPPTEPEPIERLLADFQRVVVPHTTHWNHPAFLAYFANTASAPGIIAEALAAALNNNAMLWRTGPASTELEEHACDWLRQAMSLPAEMHGHINDTASISSLVALAAARESRADLDVRRKGMTGRAELGPLTVYCSEYAHSSIDKCCALLGIGLDRLRKVPVDADYRMRPGALREMIAADRRAGCEPIAVVATVGTTSTTSVDPVPEIAEIAREHRLWLHVDAAYAGSAAICPELRERMPGMGLGDSLVVNPHKWLAVPVDCSVLFVRDPQSLRRAFSIVPEYLRTTESGATNLMDLGIQLGRRFRSLKLWFVLRGVGVSRLQAMIRRHCALAQELAGWVRSDPRFELCAPTPFSTACLRAVRAGASVSELNTLNERIVARVNATRETFLSQTLLGDRLVIRVAIGNMHTRREHVRRAWDLIVAALDDSAG